MKWFDTGGDPNLSIKNITCLNSRPVIKTLIFVKAVHEYLTSQLKATVKAARARI